MEADRIRGLDGIRAIAILGVFYTHFVDGDSLLGDLAVRTFFILSAFLITAKLVALRDAEGFSFAALRSFYARRALRLLPTYYAMVLALAAIGLVTIRDGLFYHLAFLSNIWFAMSMNWHPWVLAHVWTLSVEWQFYLIWPLVVLSCANRSVALVAAGAIAIALAFWLGCYVTGYYPDNVVLWSPFSLDAFGVGALAFFHSGMLARPVRTRLLLAILPAALWGALQLVETDGRPRLLMVVDFLLQILPLLPMAILIAITASGTSPTLNRILGARPLAYLGRISYGCYLYHFPMLWLMMHIMWRLFDYPLERGTIQLVVVAIPTVAFSALSWEFIERPIQKWGAGRQKATQAKITA
ncbi:acyltransferase [Rhizobium leguminosarum]|uniref:acyltransferase family protein n=1 Tax=Rhizobium leguminosarum TaxID=384 RepID=UPI001C948FE9|nr:acyltransferase [Rhizobium leguminosarum]MBY5360180.1 acyltransferase [Rhizobium leguminosarum]